MRRYIIAAAIAVPVLVVLFFAAGYVKEEVISDEQVSRGVSAAGIDLSRVDRATATAQVAAYEQDLVDQELTLVIDGSPVTLSPADVANHIPLYLLNYIRYVRSYRNH